MKQLGWPIFSNVYSCNDASGLPPLKQSNPNSTIVSLSIEEVTGAILTLTPHKAPGPDGIPADVFKAEPRIWGPILTVINIVAREGVPISW